MTCTDVREHLSAYYDEELAEPLYVKVAAHVEGCAECRAELDGFQQLSELSARVQMPTAPAGMWERLERELDSPSRIKPADRQRGLRSWHVVALAASVFIAAGTVIAWRLNTPQPDAHVVQNHSIERFLEEFAVDPGRAQLTLVNRYKGRSIESAGATEGLRYTPVAAQTAPDGYELEGAYVLEMPCCKCVQTIYQRDSGGSIAVFEHDDDQPDWFGSRPAIAAHCNGRPATLVEVDGELAATWKCGARCITVIGANDVQEVVRLMIDFDEMALNDKNSVPEPST